MATLALNAPREDWLEARRKFIGGSDAGSLFPEDTKYGCDVKLFFDKTGHKPDYPRTPRELQILERGHIWEEVGAMYFQEHTGLKIRRIGSRVSKSHPEMGVNMDRQIIGVTTEDLKALWPDVPAIQAMEGECGPGYLEIKTTNEWMFRAMMKDGITADYLFQVNHGLAVTGYKWGVFAVLEPTYGDFATFPVVYMPALGDEQQRRAEHFWNLVQIGEMPTVKVNDNRCKGCIYRRSCPRSAELLAQADSEFKAEGYEVDDSLAELVSDYRDAKEIVAEKEETVAEIRKRLEAAMGGRQKVEVPSCGARISWAPTKPPMRWDSKALTGTVAVIKKWDIPGERPCEVDDCKNSAEAIVEYENHALFYMCQVCAVAAEKIEQASIVARKGIGQMVAECQRAGEPSRPFKVMTL